LERSEASFWVGTLRLTGCTQYTAAAKTSALEPVAKAMDSLLAVFKKDPKLAQILLAPSLKADDKKQIITELQKHTGGSDKDNIVKNFLETLAENNRLGALEPVAENFSKLMSAYRGEVELIVTSAAVCSHPGRGDTGTDYFWVASR
jgi:F-type H+-transporting ATPase subunit O